MVKSNEILYSKGKNDECYTPEYGVVPIIEYIPPRSTIWCPFDRNDSKYVTILKEKGFKVINTHIDYGQDFYTYEPSENWDLIISNPPFSNKRKIFERALSFNKPFALLMSNTWLNDSAPVQVFGDNLELLMFDKRIKFNNNGIVQNKITFSSSYYCYRLLPRAILTKKIITK